MFPPWSPLPPSSSSVGFCSASFRGGIHSQSTEIPKNFVKPSSSFFLIEVSLVEFDARIIFLLLCRLSKETTVYFRVSHLQHMVRQGLWTDAVRYVLRFVPAIDLTDGGNFLTIFITLLSSIARYKPTVPSTFPLYDPYARHELDWQGRVRPGGVKVAEIIRSVCCKEAWSASPSPSLSCLYTRLHSVCPA